MLPLAESKMPPVKPLDWQSLSAQAPCVALFHVHCLAQLQCGFCEEPSDTKTVVESSAIANSPKTIHDNSSAERLIHSSGAEQPHTRAGQRGTARDGCRCRQR
mmetsp:Transcript_85498/g.247045  ORF Transcript_85498/g.247045 Transcript_85498/m.247045 type:complete len:103 (+) Transcript_85498:335-643(+)